ncbi:TetR/AcrR family transcriptional regulator C-terminal domain-containing protein [Granulicella cerasi]|uniref:TetR/AcrR family transcriptional regulator C-terminal domain-containing protein n=1 Tax=Granulicella cerasi TaxID=741063 RepID=A0ABW1Z546_9BACT|nr:TetR/AcrR family transcriptional regulator C-terminal domain-containing protein [Granulicella cerasi]
MNREILTRTALRLLNEVGLEQLTLRRLGKECQVQAAAMYWHFPNKEALIDEMATLLLAEAGPEMLPKRASASWNVWMTHFGEGLRGALLRCRDGGRMVVGTRLRNTDFIRLSESLAKTLVDAGFTLRQAIVLMSTVYHYTLSLVIEEQAVFPVPGELSAAYDLEARSAALAEAGLPLMKQAGSVLFERFDRRYREGLALILAGAEMQLQKRNG